MSSPLLIEEPPLQVLPSLAVIVGLNEAIILQQIHYWTKIKLAAPGKFKESFKEDRCWVYNSVRQWNEQFPFWSDNTIQRALASLRGKGVLIVKQIAPDTRDRTNWYAIDYEALNTLTAGIEPPHKKGQSTAPKLGSALPQNGVMASPQHGVMQDAKTGQCLTETPSETTQKIHQRVAPEVQKIEPGENTERSGLAPVSASPPPTATEAGWEALTETEQAPYLSEAASLLEDNLVFAKARHPERLLMPKARGLYAAKQRLYAATQKGGAE
jgi:hypothetical protein